MLCLKLRSSCYILLRPSAVRSIIMAVLALFERQTDVVGNHFIFNWTAVHLLMAILIEDSVLNPTV